MEEGRSIQERVSEEIFELIIGWIKQKKKCLGEKNPGEESIHKG